jgi:hypothetical protein
MLGLLFLACTPTSASDAGTDGGKGGGTADGGGGHDAGINADDRCEFDSRPCDAGTCMLAALDDGGIAKRCLPGACDVVAQDCDAGLKCAYQDGGRACVLDGTLNEGDPCAGAPATCSHGLVCTFVGTDGGSACARFCRLDSDCRAPQQCYVTLVLDGISERPLVCADPPMPCSPLLQNCTDPTTACYPVGGSSPGCYPVGATSVGFTCTFSNDCVKGAACVGATGMTTCQEMCAWPSGTPSCSGKTCTRIGMSDTGVCL